MSGEKVIVYFGDDEDFCDSLEGYCKAAFVSNYKIFKAKYEPQMILEIILRENPGVVFIDFTSTPYIEDLFNEISFLKKISQLRSTFFSCLLSGGDYSSKLRHLYASGFQSSFIKSAEVESFISDSIYIGFGDRLATLQYAKADNVDNYIEVGLCSSLTKLSAENFHVETDLSLDCSHLSFELSLFKDLEARKFKVEKHYPTYLLHPLTDTYLMNFPYIGPWGEITTETIQKETVETWIDLNRDKLIKKSSTIKIFSFNTEIYPFLLESTTSYAINIEVNNKICTESLRNEFILKKYPLLLIDLNEETSINMSCVPEVINIINLIQDYNPIIIILNTPSKAEAFQKLYGYKNIVSVPKVLSPDVFNLFMKSFMIKSEKLYSLYFSFSDIRRAIDIKYDIFLTSMTEHEVTFISKDELPLYTVIEFYYPVRFFVTIVPPYDDLKSNSSGHHYMGLINGVSEEDKQILRKFINQIIFKPLEDFSKESVMRALQQKNDKKAVVEDSEKVKKIEIAENKNKVFQRPAAKGRSKL